MAANPRMAVTESEKTLVEKARTVEKLRERVADLRLTRTARLAKLEAEFDAKIDLAEKELEQAQRELVTALGSTANEG